MAAVLPSTAIRTTAVIAASLATVIFSAPAGAALKTALQG
jgi:hypothetical protein